MIKCIFLSKFHHKLGPIISHQDPEGYISKGIFDGIQNFIITKPELQNRLVKVNAFDYKFIGCPISIDSDKYKRNALIFNVCFTFNESSDSAAFGPIVKKLADYMTQLERELELLSNEDNSDKVVAMLKDVRDGLNKRGTCSIYMAESCTIHLKALSAIHKVISVQDHQVPVLTVPRDVMAKYQWDLTTQQILPYIDGISHVLKIAAEADVELNLVKADLQNLLHYKFLKLVPIFQYCNQYVVTCDVNKLVEDSRLQKECVKFVSKSDRSLAEVKDVYVMYCSFIPGTSVKDLCLKANNPHSLKIDERKLVQFGIMNGLLRRLHQYPTFLPGSEPLSIRLQPIIQMLDGCHSLDQICCQTGFSHHELEDLIELDDNVIMCWK